LEERDSSVSCALSTPLASRRLLYKIS